MLTGSARNADRHRLFEQPIKPKITKRDRALEKKREGLARVLERLQASDVRPGLAKELRQQVATLGQEIAKWSGADRPAVISPCIRECGQRRVAISGVNSTVLFQSRAI